MFKSGEDDALFAMDSISGGVSVSIFRFGKNYVDKILIEEVIKDG